MKKILFGLLLIACLISCEDANFKCFNEVQKKYPNSIVMNRLYEFIAIDDEGNVHFIETKGRDNSITYDAIILKSKK